MARNDDDDIIPDDIPCYDEDNGRWDTDDDDDNNKNSDDN